MLKYCIAAIVIYYALMGGMLLVSVLGYCMNVGG